MTLLCTSPVISYKSCLPRLFQRHTGHTIEIPNLEPIIDGIEEIVKNVCAEAGIELLPEFRQPNAPEPAHVQLTAKSPLVPARVPAPLGQGGLA
jgi:hypothetical protein